MRFAYCVFLVLVLGLGQKSFSQVIDNTSSFKDLGDHYFRFHYDNDYFTKTDEFYTQGITLEYVHPALKRIPGIKPLYTPEASDIRYGISIDHYVYTPTSIRSDSILYGDRPFCANLSLKLFSIAVSRVRGERLATSLVLGLMGPGAGGKEMQTSIHRWLANVKPHGWQYQIKNDLILDYSVNYERRIAAYRHLLQVNGVMGARIGTHNDNLKGGINFMIGHLNNDVRDRKFHYYLYGQLAASLVGYDATLQGGLLNRNSPYTIHSGDITRGTLQGDYGITVTFGKIYLEYCQSVLTREYATGGYHRWGGIRIGISG